jgi:hypothetical protein
VRIQVSQYSPVELTEDDIKAQNLLKKAEKLEDEALWLPSGAPLLPYVFCQKH